MTEKFTMADLKGMTIIGMTIITSEFDLVYYYEKGGFDYVAYGFNEVADAVAKAKDVLKEDKSIRRVNVVYMATVWDVDGGANTIIEKDIMEILR